MAAIAQQYQALCGLCLQAAAHPYHQDLQIHPLKLVTNSSTQTQYQFTDSISTSFFRALHAG